MINSLYEDAQRLIFFSVAPLLATLPIRATNKALKQCYDQGVKEATKRTSKKWNIQQLRGQVPWNYLRNIDHVSQEERNAISRIYKPYNRPPTLIRQDAMITEVEKINKNLVNWGVEDARDPGWYIQDYIWAVNTNHPKKSGMEHRYARHFCVQEAARVARHERVFKQVYI